MTCYEVDTGKTVWEFTFESTQIEMGTALIAGQNIYIQTTSGYIYTFNWKEGPGNDNINVISTPLIEDVTVPLEYKSSYGQGPAAMVFDSGCIFVKSHNGMVYCFDKNLNLLWSYQMLGPAYYSPVTVKDNYVFAGTYDGCLYILNKTDGTIIHKEIVYQTVDSDLSKIGSCATPILIETDNGYRVFVSYSDGLGMNSHISSLMLYDFNTSTNTLTKLVDFVDYEGTEKGIGTLGTLLTRYVTEDFKGIIAATNRGIYKIDIEGEPVLINNLISNTLATHATPTLVNNSVMFISTYSTQQIYEMDMEGNILGVTKFDNRWFSMATVCVVDGYIIRSDDNGVNILGGSILGEYVPPSTTKSMPLWQKMLIAIGIVIAIIVIMWAVLKFAVGWQKPFHELHSRVMRYFFGENYSHNTKSKRRLHAMIIIGILITIVASLASLCLGSETNLTINEALSSMISSIQKGGRGLNYNEMLIYNQRLPRTLATISVGIGLSIAGATYQAVIKNPLVEPYIMGVSSGAGTFAVAVILANFTFFGLFSSQSIYLTAFSAIVGGLLAFGCTMLIAEKTGGKSINYVLAGIVIGLVFSAIQSILMIQSGTKMSNALSWLYGSFASITWDKLWLVLIPCITLSCIPLVWAKELNLVLLGEDQAMQMGLNAKRFDRIMLIFASILTAFCVAFCGIIGFVGLVIPHLSRMLMGGDHRLMLPVSMAFGGCLMTVADLLARILLTGYELPVGAITTIIGVPVFAYLLIKRGGKYNG
jgi:iron complex transport system permease protein